MARTAHDEGMGRAVEPLVSPDGGGPARVGWPRAAPGVTGAGGCGQSPGGATGASWRTGRGPGAHRLVRGLVEAPEKGRRLA